MLRWLLGMYLRSVAKSVLLGAGTGGDSMHAVYSSFPGCYSSWKEQIEYQPLNTYHAVGAMLFAFFVSVTVDPRVPSLSHFTNEKIEP